MTRILLNRGAYVDPQDASGRTPLIISCQKNDSTMCNLLVDNGASVRMFDSNGDTPLHHACRVKSIICARVVIGHSRVNVESQNFFGDTPLHLACATGSITLCRTLLDKGASSTLKNRSGKTPVDSVPSDNPRLRSILIDYARSGN